jgi:hypothetical protein
VHTQTHTHAHAHTYTHARCTRTHTHMRIRSLSISPSILLSLSRVLKHQYTSPCVLGNSCTIVMLQSHCYTGAFIFYHNPDTILLMFWFAMAHRVLVCNGSSCSCLQWLMSVVINCILVRTSFMLS